MRNHQLRTWIKRKVACIHVTRARKDGVDGGCSVPCVSCRARIMSFDLRVVCTRDDGTVFEGRLSDPGAPKSKMTSGQKRQHTPR